MKALVGLGEVGAGEGLNERDMARFVMRLEDRGGGDRS